MPDDNNTIPLINTIRETTIAAIAKKYNIETAQKRFDISHSQSDSEYITSAIGEYNDTIQDIIDNIPDVPPTPPGPTLPTIEKIQSKYGNTAPSITFDPGVKSNLYYSSNSNLITYDPTKAYIYRGKIVNDSGEWDARLTYQLYAYNNNGVVAVENISSDWGVSAEGWLFSCDDPSVDVIYVKRTADSKLFWAFKKTIDGTNYYYVLSETDWVSDLSTIGFETSQTQPDIPVQLPSVSNFGFIMHNNPVTINAGNTNSDFYIGTTGQPATYDLGKLYGAISALDSIGGNKVNQTYISLVNDNGEIAVKNVSQSSITIEVVTISECSSNQAEVITVYDSQSNTFNAFKYTVDGVDYYYVLDGTQTDWTDDLSSIGYHLPVVLPIVTTSGYWNNNQYNWLQSTEGPENVPANSLSSVLHYGYAEGAQTVYVYPDYEPGKKYGIVQWQQSGGTTSGRTEFEIVESNGKMCVKNVYGGTLTFYQAKVAVCSSNQATVITVYNSSNTAYNAFKFTANNADYYYVLDGTQTDWTDDLSSIGYHLPQLWNLKVYGQDGGTISLSQENNFMYVFEEPNNRYIMLNGGTSSTVWEIISIIDTNGNEVSKESDYIWWINRSNIYYKASPTRSVSAAYILLKTTPPLI